MAEFTDFGVRVVDERRPSDPGADFVSYETMLQTEDDIRVMYDRYEGKQNFDHLSIHVRGSQIGAIKSKTLVSDAITIDFGSGAVVFLSIEQAAAVRDALQDQLDAPGMP